MVLPNKQENEEVKNQVIELYELEKKYKAIKESYENKKSKLSLAIRNFMYCRKGANDEFEFFAQSGDTFSKENSTLRVRKITPTTVTWDADKLESRLTKELATQVIKKQYTITDIRQLISYLKECGVDAKIFKSYIDVEKTVDTKVLEQLDALGEISYDDIKGCYTTQEKSSYLRIDVLKEDE